MQAPISFLTWTPNRWLYHAAILHSLWCIFFATFSKQNLAGSRDATKLWGHKWYSLRPMLQGNRVLSHVTCFLWQKWRYYAWFGSGDGRIWPLALHIDLSKVIRVNDLDWPHNTYLVTIFTFLLVSLSPETECVAIFYSNMFTVLLYNIRCQPEPLTRFALRRRFCRWGWRCSLPWCYAYFYAYMRWSQNY